nr:MAG TPA: hypothetical protein [Crassvirales sp.]
MLRQCPKLILKHIFIQLFPSLNLLLNLFPNLLFLIPHTSPITARPQPQVNTILSPSLNSY